MTWSSTWPPGRDAALGRLAAFLPRVPRYAADRNFVRPDDPAESRLSPYLRHRIISEEELIAAVVGAHPFAVAEKFVQEVLWRTHWKGALHLAPTLWLAYLEQLAAFEEEASAAAWSDLHRRAVEGRTGLACFDDWVHELRASGTLHNHVRMWFASIWIFTFRIPWQLGAAFMHHYLLDGDPASNTLSWRWVAGLQTKGKRYLATADTIDRCTDGRWRPRPGELASETFAVPDEPCRQPYPTPLRPTDEPRPGDRAILLTTDDLSVDRLDDLSRYRSACVLQPGGPTTSLKRDFLAGAVADLADRVGGQAGLPRPTVATTADEIVAWIRAADVSHVTVNPPQVGPLLPVVRDAIDRMQPLPVSVGLCRRRWDTSLHPLCNKGFFVTWARWKKRFDGGLDAGGLESTAS